MTWLNKILWWFSVEKLIKELREFTLEFQTHISSVKIDEHKIAKALKESNNEITTTLYDQLVIKPLGPYPERYLQILWKHRILVCFFSYENFKLYHIHLRETADLIDQMTSSFILINGEKTKKIRMTMIAESSEFQRKFLVGSPGVMQ